MEKLQKIYYGAVIAFVPYGWAGFITGFVVVVLSIIIFLNQNFPYENLVSYIAGLTLSIIVLVFSNRKYTWFERMIIALDKKMTDPYSWVSGRPILEEHRLIDKHIGWYVGIGIYILTYSLVHQSYYSSHLIPFIFLLILMVVSSIFCAEKIREIYLRQCIELDKERQFIKECLRVDDPIPNDPRFN